MKRIIYRIGGSLTEDMIPPLQASLEAVDGVAEARLALREGEAELALTLTDAGTNAAAETEASLRAALETKGLFLADGPSAAEEDPPEPAGEPKAGAPAADESKTGEPPAGGPRRARRRPTRRIGLTAAVASVAVSVVLAVLLTFSLTVAYYRADAPRIVQPGPGSRKEGDFAALDVLDRLFRSQSILEPDRQALLVGALKGYVAAAGDTYAEYLTADELTEMRDQQSGKMSGIGVSVVQSVMDVDGAPLKVFVIANVYPESPAGQAGVLPGDAIFAIGTEGENVRVDALGYTQALARLRGEKGTVCAFAVLRGSSSKGGKPETLFFSVVRDEFTSRSVFGRRLQADETVGVVRITGFDHTTASQFRETMDDLLSRGCERFVFDLRYNPGGLLSSIEDVLTYFLNEGDLILSTKNRSGDQTEFRLTVSDAGLVEVGSRALKREDVGRYRALRCAVLVNGYTASAAELFTANMRDYRLGRIVGTTTFGKGSMQTTYDLSAYGYDGALKLTTHSYYPPCGEGYDGIGIEPDVTVELSEEAEGYNINLLPEELDNQLTEAARAAGEARAADQAS